MTASADRRRRSTTLGGIAGLVAVVSVVVVSIVSYSTLRTSEEGRAPEVDRRESVSFPSTPNAVVGVVDDLDRLTSIAVFALDPSGAGGSIVTVPVNADQTNGFGSERLPISRQPYSPGNEEHELRLLSELEPLLTLTIERAAVIGPDELAELLDAVGPIDVDLPERVVDSDRPGSGFVAREGNHFVLNGRPYYFAGCNNYYQMVYAADPGLRHYVDEVQDEAIAMELTVLRTWAFNDGADEWNALQITPGVYQEYVFQGLDYVLHRADQVGLRLILSLVNYWSDYGGMDQYIEWSPTATTRDDFYVDPDCRRR